MATKKKPAPKSKKTIGKKPVAKAKPAKKAAKPVKKASKAPAKKAVKPVKKAAKSVVKKTAKKPVAKAKPVNKKPIKTNKTVTKKVSKPATKKPAAKKAAPAKKQAKIETKKAPIAKAKPVKEAPKKAAAPVPAPNAKKASKKTKLVKTIKAPITSNKPAPAPVVRPAENRTLREEKKPNVIIAHRKLENKSKEKTGKTMVNYKPEHTRSILDMTPVEEGPVYRYSDEELAEFKELILERLEAARKELAYQQGLITRKDEAGTEDTENRYMNMEDGSGAMEREQLSQLASRQIQFIGHLEKALLRIENKTYGICRVTNKLIDKARLRAVPHATLSIEAKNMMSKK